MIGTITINPCIDSTIKIGKFTYGGMNRVIKKRKDISGKGINVSIVLEQLGFKTITMGISYKNDYDYIREELKKYNIDYKSIITDGNLRENIKMLNEEDMITTEFNQQGEYIPNEKIEKFLELLDLYIDNLKILVVDGSVPAGVDLNLYYRIIEKARNKNVVTFLDAEGELFLNGVKAKPNIVKPNLYELQVTYGLKGDKIEDILNICKKIISDGIEVVCVSMGSKGALIVNNKEAYICKPSKIDVISSQGAGDSMVAGICIAYLKNKSIDEMLRYGVAAAQGSLIREGTLLCLKNDFEKFIKELSINKLF